MAIIVAAAFGRLCVETLDKANCLSLRWSQPPSGGCVLKLSVWCTTTTSPVAAAFGRLCVETIFCLANAAASPSSRLRAAVC